MPIILYFVALLLLLILASILINGWFLVTRGQWREEVDGTMVKEGALLKGWWFFWFKEKEDKKHVAYRGKYLVELFLNLQGVGSNRVTSATIGGNYKAEIKRETDSGFPIPEDEVYRIVIHGNYSPALEAEIEQKLGVKVMSYSPITAGVDTKQTIVELYKEEPDYVYPTWLRTVMAGCITCFASVYGTIIYLVFVNLFPEEINYTLPKISRYPVALGLFTWIAYMLCLAYLNTYLHKKLNK